MKIIAVCLLVLTTGAVAACADDSASHQPSGPAASATSTPGQPSVAAAGLPAGSYRTSQLSREMLIDAGARVGFTAEQVEAALLRDQIAQSATFTLTFDGHAWQQRYDYGHAHGVGSRGTYTVEGDQLTLTEPCCGSFSLTYTFDGQTLILAYPADGPTVCGGDVSCQMGVLIFAGVPYTKVD